MRQKHFTENFATGYQSTQSGGALGSDSAERFAKNLLSKVTGKSNTTVKKEKPQKNSPTVNTTVDKAEPKKTADTDISLPTGISKGRYVQVKKGDQVSYTTSTGSDSTGVVVNVIDDAKLKIKQDNNLLVIKSKDIAQVNNQDWKLKEQTLKDGQMNNKKVNEGLAELAGVAEKDHEVQMARADLYKIAKYAIKLHEMLKGVSETEGLEGWQQAKITKAADYISSVYHNLDYDMKFKEQMPQETLQISDIKKESTDPYKKKLAEKLAKKIA